MSNTYHTPPAEMLADALLAHGRENLDGSGEVVIIRKDEKMLWGVMSGLTRAGRAYMESATPIVVAEVEDETEVEAEEETTTEDVAEDETKTEVIPTPPEVSAGERRREPLQDEPKVMAAQRDPEIFLNNPFARFTVDGELFSGPEMTPKMFGRVSLVEVPSYCRLCNKVWNWATCKEHVADADYQAVVTLTPPAKGQKKKKKSKTAVVETPAVVETLAVAETPSTIVFASGPVDASVYEQRVTALPSLMKDGAKLPPQEIVASPLPSLSFRGGFRSQTLDRITLSFCACGRPYKTPLMDAPAPFKEDFYPNWNICECGIDRRKLTIALQPPFWVLWSVGDGLTKKGAEFVAKAGDVAQPPMDLSEDVLDKLMAVTRVTAAPPVEMIEVDEAEVDEPLFDAPEVAPLPNPEFEGFEVIALREARRGFRVFPVRPDGKAASIKKFPELATTDENTIREWAKRFPDASVGLLATVEGTLSIDEDFSREFRAGYEAFAHCSFPSSHTTTSRDNHCQSTFLQTDYSRTKLRNIPQGKTKDGMFSLRFRNMYVLGEGSRHYSGSLYRLTNTAEAQPVSNSLVDYIFSLDTRNTDQPRSTLSAAPTAVKATTTAISTAVASAAKAGEGSIPPEMDVLLGEHERNDGVSRYAYHVCQNETRDWSEVLERVRAYNAAHCVPPLPDVEIVAIVNGKKDKPLVGSLSVYSSATPKNAEAPATENKGVPSGLVFHQPQVTGGAFDYAIAPPEKLGAKRAELWDGWFPRGGVSLIGASSGGGKTTLMYDLLDKQKRGESVLGHKTFGLPFAIVIYDRGKASHERAMEAYGLTGREEDFPTKNLPPTLSDPIEIVQAIVDYVESRTPRPAILYIEGGDIMADDASKAKEVILLLAQLKLLAEHYHLAIILSVGMGKVKVGEEYVAQRDKIFGSIMWGRMSETIVTLMYPEGDDTEVRRRVYVLRRHSMAEKFNMIFNDGRLVLDDQPPVSKDPAELAWFKTVGKGMVFFTSEDLRIGLNTSITSARRKCSWGVEAGYLRLKTGPKTKGVKGGADAKRYRYLEPSERFSHADGEPDGVENED